MVAKVARHFPVQGGWPFMCLVWWPLWLANHLALAAISMHRVLAAAAMSMPNMVAVAAI